MKRTATLIVVLTLLVAACGYGTVGNAGNLPGIPDTTDDETLDDLLTTQVSSEGEPSEPEVTLTDSSEEQTGDTATDAGSPIDTVAFEHDERVDDLISELAAILESGGDLRPLVAQRGLYVAYNDEPILYSRADLAGILADEETRQWPSHLVSADDPAAADLPYRTFAQEIGGSFLEAFNDPANQFLRNEWSSLDDKGIPEEANPLPVELRRFNTVSIADGGHDGIEWFVWYVSIDYENDEPRIVGLTFHAWIP